MNSPFDSSIVKNHQITSFIFIKSTAVICPSPWTEIIANSIEAYLEGGRIMFRFCCIRMIQILEHVINQSCVSFVVFIKRSMRNENCAARFVRQQLQPIAFILNYKLNVKSIEYSQLRLLELLWIRIPPTWNDHNVRATWCGLPYEEPGNMSGAAIYCQPYEMVECNRLGHAILNRQ